MSFTELRYDLYPTVFIFPSVLGKSGLSIARTARLLRALPFECLRSHIKLLKSPVNAARASQVDLLPYPSRCAVAAVAGFSTKSWKMNELSCAIRVQQECSKSAASH